MDLLLLPIRFALAFPEIVALIGSYWLLTHLAERRAVQAGIPAGRLGDVSFFVGLGAVAGARLPFVLAYPQAYVANPLDLLRINMGLSFYGGLAAGIMTALLLNRRTQLPLWRLADSYALYLPVGIGIYRSACLVAADCYGRVAPAPFGVVFPGLTQPRYPAELYEAAFALCIFGLLIWLSRRQIREGTLALTFLAAYPLARFAVGFTRVNLDGLPISPDQVLSLGIALGAAAILVYRERHGAGVNLAASHLSPNES